MTQRRKRGRRSKHVSQTDPLDIRAIFGDPAQIAMTIAGHVERARQLVLAIEPEVLLAEQYLRMVMTIYGRGKESEMPYDSQVAIRILEFMHSVYSSFASTGNERPLKKGDLELLWSTVAKLDQVTSTYEMVTIQSVTTKFAGGNASDIEFWARANWKSIRRNRYPTHDLPFYGLALTPHSELLQQAYGIGLDAILDGIQAIHTAIHTGPMPYLAGLADMSIPIELKSPWITSPTQTLAAWDSALDSITLTLEGQAYVRALTQAEYLNVSRITGWPQSLIEDLSYRRGDVTHFFDGGPRSGWPTKTLPMRRKPFLLLGENAYTFDMAFSIEAMYRAIQLGVQDRVTNARVKWEIGQSQMAETVFPNLFAPHLEGARILRSVRYKPLGGGGNWAECDCIVVLDDTLLVIEAKAGLLGFAPPDEEFASVLERLKRLTLDAHTQANRFLEYLDSRDEAPLFELVNGKYVQIDALKLIEYRAIVPMAVTIENLSPFGGLLKQLPDAGPLLGKYPFLVFAIDDLLPIAELLPDGGSLMHFLEVRQAIAERKNLRIHDEMDHLGVYISQNRAETIGANERRADMVAFIGGSDYIDQYYFELFNERLGGEPATPAPRQKLPVAVADILGLLENERPKLWLLANSRVRNLDGRTRTLVDVQINKARRAAQEGRHTAFHVPGLAGISLAINGRYSKFLDKELIDMCNAASIAFGVTERVLVTMSINDAGNFYAARVFLSQNEDPSEEAKVEAEALAKRVEATVAAYVQKSDVGRNEPCPCGSGRKFKKCHGS
jgi:hypothetical protein